MGFFSQISRKSKQDAPIILPPAVAINPEHTTSQEELTGTFALAWTPFLEERFSREVECSRVGTETNAKAGASCIQHVSAVSLELSSLRLRTNAIWTHSKKYIDDDAEEFART